MPNNLTFDQVQIAYSKRKSIVLQVKNGQVFLKAPVRTSLRYLQELFIKKQNWISKKLELNIQNTQTKKENVALDLQTLQLYKTKLTKYLDFKLSIFATRLAVTYTKFAVKKITSRWGSCSSRGNLNFSLYLWNTPSFVIDYVIIHELCHRRHMNHSKAFWNLVKLHCPDCELAKEWLKTNGKSVM